MPPLRLALLFTLLLLALSLLPRPGASPWLAGSVQGAGGLLLLLRLVLRRRVERDGRTLGYDFVPLPVHWVQAAMQACVYAYWGWYWPEVRAHVPLIAAQIAFAYAFDMLVCWFRRDRWTLGFGPFPIILSTNLFLWFRDEWFFLQLAMVATGVLGKEFVKWTRDGRVVHVFNPSALSLFLFSLGLIATGSTGITWGPEIAATLGRPPGIYLEIFLVGLVVQALFSVTLVTLAAAATLYAMNLVHTEATGTYHFVVTNVPVAVFLGLHLLVTDPATSPRTALGRILFGALYGAGTYGLFGLLGWFGLPTFYDKLLPVPVLNPTVRWLDRTSRALGSRLRAIVALPAPGPRAANLAAMGAWAALFATMTATGFLATDHPGRAPEFWRRACEEGRGSACRTWAKLLDFFCERGEAASCRTLGDMATEGRGVARDLVAAGKRFARACDLEDPDGCERLERLVRGDGRGVFLDACGGGDGESCFLEGELRHHGIGVPRDEAAALDLYRRSCASGWPRGCGRLGQAYLAGDGAAADAAKAIESFETACGGGHAASCSAVAALYDDGRGGFRNAALASERLRRACELGLRAACRSGDGSRSAPMDAATELLKLGG